MRPLLVAAACALVLSGSDAFGATRPFAETYDARTGAQGDAQVETWVDDVGSPANWDVWRIWWGGTASVTDALEVSVYGIAAQQAEGSASSSGVASTGLQLEMAYFMARYRLLGSGDEGFSAMVQLDYCLPILPTAADQATYAYLAHANSIGERLIASYQHGRFLAAANLLLDENFILNAAGSGETFVFTAKYAAGAAFSLLPPGPRGLPLTLGAEVFGDFPFARSQDGALWWPGGVPVAVGPAASVAFGRFWATASWGYAPGGGYLLYTPATGKPSWTGAETFGRLIAAFEF